MARFIVAPQWQGSSSSRAMQLIDGAEAIAGDLPRGSTTVLDAPTEAGDAQGTRVHRLSASCACASASKTPSAVQTDPRS